MAKRFGVDGIDDVRDQWTLKEHVHELEELLQALAAWKVRLEADGISREVIALCGDAHVGLESTIEVNIASNGEQEKWIMIPQLLASPVAGKAGEHPKLQRILDRYNVDRKSNERVHGVSERVRFTSRESVSKTNFADLTIDVSGNAVKISGGIHPGT